MGGSWIYFRVEFYGKVKRGRVDEIFFEEE